MICPKCNWDNAEGSVFCNKCGVNLSGAIQAKHNFKLFSTKRNIIMACAALVILIFVVVEIVNFSNPVSAFKSNINNNKYAEATKIYNEKIKGDTEKENSVNSFLKDYITKIQKSFSEGKIDYDTAKISLETIRNTQLASSDVSNAMDKINALNNSRIAFSKAEEFLRNKDLANALKEYKKVIPDDSNYNKAKEQIANNEKQYKEQVLKNAEDFANNKDYDKALGILSEALSILPNDQDINAKNAVYQKLQDEKLAAERKQKMDELAKNQEVSVQNITINKDWLDDYYISITVKNNTNKVVKKYVVGWMGFDKYGYPVKTGWLSPDFLKEGYAEANIQPGNTYGSDKGWELTGGFDKTMEASKFIACVKEVEYYDGSKWTNEYYNYWKDEYMGKQYK
ncbi:MAG: hypothetical protein PWQ59_164 [Thermoanaerobacterium sp.]|nr:hypothetical protein [Thermoanaerobacterium sp.]